MIRLLLILPLLVASLHAASLDDLTWTIADGEVTIVDCKSDASGELEIPSHIEGLPVTAVGMGAFSGCYALESIAIPDSVTTIGSSAFSSCYSITEVILPAGLVEIENHSFYCCVSLKSVVIPEGVMIIGDWAFAQCQSLTQLIIPDSVTSIGAYAFEYCPWDMATVFGPGLQTVTFGKGLTDIGDFAFYEQPGLGGVTIPASTTFIGHNGIIAWDGDITFDGAAPEVPEFDPFNWYSPIARRIHVWPQYVDSFASEHYLWSKSEIIVRDTSPKISLLSVGEGSVTISITGAPDTSYVCKTSSDLETFDLVTTCLLYTSPSPRDRG